jgi:tetratricopeptide (TPR) repeat protein
MRPRADVVVGTVVIAALIAAAIEVVRVRERVYPAAEISDDPAVYITSPAAVSRAALAYRALAADLYWIRAVQYFGGTRRMLQQGAPDLNESRRRYVALYPMLDLATSLDPRFSVAYRFGAIFLAEPPPGGPGRPDLAIKLLEKGVRERPDKWEYLQDIGFVHYWWRRDYREAARYFQRASDVPGAPWWLRSLAATTLTQGGDRQSSRQMWTALRDSADNDWLRADAQRRLVQLDALDQIDQLQAIVNQVAARQSTPVTGWSELVGRVLRGVPLDPTGRPYEIDAAGRVRLSRASPLWPLPDEPPPTPQAPPPA